MLAFASIRNEVNTRPLVEAVLASGTRVAFPRVAGDELTLHLVASYDDLVEGAFSVPEPPEDAARLQPQDVEFALVPALAVDSRGYRIGYGGGYYDRLVPTLSGALTCAIAYDFQLVAEVPEQPFDAAVDVIVTDARVIRSA